MKPPNQKKSFEYKGYKNNFQQTKYTQQRDTQVIIDTFTGPSLSPELYKKRRERVDNSKDYFPGSKSAI